MPDTADKPIRVAVIGAGIAGLTAALRLAERGYEVAVFEDRINVGGELGAHRGRIPINLGSIEKENPKVAAEIKSVFVDVTKSSTLQPGEREKLELALKDRRVPEWMQYVVGQRWRLLREKIDLGPEYVPPEDITVDPVPKGQVPHDAQAEWRVTEKKGRRSFTIAIQLREDKRPQLELSDDVYHEHCYHMFLNWYHNFWDLMQAIGREQSQAFSYRNAIHHVFPGAQPLAKRTRTLSRLSSIETAADNLLSGVVPAPDLFLYLYSVADLVSQRLNPARYLDRTSVHAFMTSRWYATEESVKFHEHLLAKAFAVPTFFSSAFAYRKYVEYSVIQPDPMLWVLNEDSYNGLFASFIETFRAHKGELNLGTYVTEILGDSENYDRIVGLRYRPSDMRGWPRNPDDGERPSARDVPQMTSIFEPDYVIVALPPNALAELLNKPELRAKVPGLSTIRRLRSGVTAALDLYFTRKLEGLPADHCLLRDSRLGLTFIDNSQCWSHPPSTPEKPEGEPVTCLNVAVTDFYAVEGMNKNEATSAIIADLRRFISFEDEDVDYSRTYLQMNDLEPLFLNEVGSEPWRPGTHTEIRNLFLAGDFVDNHIGIVSVEGAVVSGLLAAQAVQARARKERALSSDTPYMKPIPVKRPDTYPLVNADALKVLMMPYLGWAKAWSRAEELARHPERAVSPREAKALVADVLAAPGAMATDLASYAVEWARWAADQAHHDRRG